MVVFPNFEDRRIAFVKEKKKKEEKKEKGKFYSGRKKFVEICLFYDQLRRLEVSPLWRPKGTALKAFAITNGKQWV